MSAAAIARLLRVVREGSGWRQPPPIPGTPPMLVCAFCGSMWCSDHRVCGDRRLWLRWRSWTTRRGLARRLGRRLERLGRRLQGQSVR